MSKIKVKLSSYCNVKGCEGAPGDVVDMDEAQASDIIEGRGGVLCGTVAETKKTETSAKK